MSRWFFFGGLAVLAAFAPIASARADVPQTFSYQGVLTNDAGVVVPDGAYDLEFRLYDVPTDGAPLWTEARNGVAVQGGLFSLLLGEVAPIALPFDAPYWLGIAVNGGVEMSPRVALGASPYALGLRLPLSALANSGTPGFAVTNIGGGAAITANPLLDVQGTLQVAGAGSTMLVVGDNAGDAAVNLPGDAVSAAEVLDEPGVASTTATAINYLPSSGYGVLASRTINAPADGWVLVMSSFNGYTYHNSGVASNAHFGVSNVPDALSANQQLWIGIASTMPSNFYNGGYTPHGLFPVSAGANTFYTLGRKSTTDPVFVTNVQMTLVYFPTAYGVVAPSVANEAAASSPADRFAAGEQRPGASPADIAAEQREAAAQQGDRVQRELSELRDRVRALEAGLRARPAARTAR